MKKEAIILAGGLGTRLRSIVQDVPKPMADVAGRPFLDYIMFFLSKNNISKVILAVGHKHEIIQDYYNKNNFGIEVSFSIETELLGTGGAIFQAAEQVHGEKFFIINGDTFFDISLEELAAFAELKKAEIAIALRRIQNSHRYGHIHCAETSQIISFRDKGEKSEGYNIINGGIYYMNKDLFNKFKLPQKFSFEVDFLQSKLRNMKAYGKEFDGRFIDIGIPEDFELAQSLLKDVIQ